MKRTIIIIFIAATALMSCNGNNERVIRNNKAVEKVIGKWEHNLDQAWDGDASWIKAFEITKAGSKYFFEVTKPGKKYSRTIYSHYREPIKFNQDDSTTQAHKKAELKAELVYDSLKEVYRGKMGYLEKLSIELSVPDEEHLQLTLPFETIKYSRVKE